MKTLSESRAIFIALATVAVCVNILHAQPSLGISSAGNQSILYWSATPTNYILQSTTNLASPNWVTANDAVPVTGATVSNTSPARFFRLVNTDPPAGMVLIPAGSFSIGNSIGDSDITDATPTNVYVSAFYMDTNLVTYGLWQTVYNAAITFNGYSFVLSGAGKAANNPAVAMDWYDCVKWCNARSQLSGLTPVYYTDAGLTQVYKTGQVTPYVNWTASGFRLPTEAEWEKAARGGLSGRRFPWGNLISETHANYSGNTNSFSYDFGPNGYNSIGSIGGTAPATSPGGSFDANGYGLNDMAGNVFAFCWDYYSSQPYPAGSPYLGGTDPHGPATGSYIVLRGGSWATYAFQARCAYRLFRTQGAADYLFGFRCVKGL